MVKKAKTIVHALPALKGKTYNINGIGVSRQNVDRDPLDVDVRTYIRIHCILERIEDGDEITLREEIAALALIERLRPKDTATDANTGSAVRKYENAFKNDGRRGKKNSGADAEPDSDWFEQDTGADPEHAGADD